jgi:D-3-phosphoglycerate dehydrogenase
MMARTTYRVLITSPYIVDEAVEVLEKRCSLHKAPPQSQPAQIVELASRLSIDGMIVRQGLISKEVLSASPNLRIVVKHGVGVDNIDISAATELGIPVCITPGANYQSVAEHALAMILALSKNLFFKDSQIRDGIWDKVSNPATELYKKCLGIIGIGRIGRRLAELVQPLEMNIIGYDPYLPENLYPAIIQKVEDLKELLRKADFISLHCPKSIETINMIGEEELKIIKPTAILINTSRGGIIDELALARAMEGGRIGAAGLDCFTNEPIPSHHPLLSIKERLIMTPHVAGATEEALVRMGKEAAHILINYLEKRELDPDVLMNRRVLCSQSLT